MYKYAKDTYNGSIENPEYDGIGRRQKSKGGKEFTGVPGIRKIGGSSGINRRRRMDNNNYSSNQSRNLSNNVSNSSLKTMNNNNHNNSHNNNSNNNGNNMYNNSVLNAKLEEIKKENIILKNEKNILENKLNDMNKEYDNLVKTAADIEKERDFYFEKVLKVEQICKEFSDQSLPLINKIYNLLYQNDNTNTAPPAGINTSNIPPENPIQMDRIDNDTEMNNNGNANTNENIVHETNMDTNIQNNHANEQQMMIDQ